MNCKTGNVLLIMLNALRNVKFIYKKKSHHILDMLPIFPCKRIDLWHKISIIQVSITRPNSTKNITCPKQTICTYILSYKTVVSSFTLK